MGAANAAAGFTQGFSVGASGSRTAVNDDMGARSQIAGLSPPSTVGARPALPHRAGAVPAEGRARRGDRLRGDRAGRAAGLARARGGRPRRGRDRRRDDRLRRRLRRPRGARRRGRALDHRRRPPQRPRRTTRCSAGSSGSAATPTSRVHPSATVTPGRRRLPPRRPAVLRQRALRQGPHPRGDPRGADAHVVARLRRGGDDPRRLDRARGARGHHERPPPRRDHARRRAPATRMQRAVRAGRTDRDDRARSASTRRCAPPSTPAHKRPAARV